MFSVSEIRSHKTDLLWYQFELTSFVGNRFGRSKTGIGVGEFHVFMLWGNDVCNHFVTSRCYQDSDSEAKLRSIRKRMVHCEGSATQGGDECLLQGRSTQMDSGGPTFGFFLHCRTEYHAVHCHDVRNWKTGSLASGASCILVILLSHVKYVKFRFLALERSYHSNIVQ